MGLQPGAFVINYIYIKRYEGGKNMGLFSRMGALVRGFFGMFVGGVEEKNPNFYLRI
jgi:hypothetical protein